MTAIFRILLGLLLCSAAQAHQQQTALTSVLFNTRTGQIEISHRLYVHDAEHAIKIINPTDYDLLTSQNARTNLIEYVAERFTLMTEPHTTGPLSLVGGEIEGKFFWVYQETPIPPLYKQGKEIKLNVENSILMEFFSKQKNIVNIEYDNKVDTLIYYKKSGLQTKFIQADNPVPHIPETQPSRP